MPRSSWVNIKAGWHDAAAIAEPDIAAMRTAGFDDGEILEINQLFADAKRTVQGLRVTTDDDILGRSPSNAAATCG